MIYANQVGVEHTATDVRLRFYDHHSGSSVLHEAVTEIVMTPDTFAAMITACLENAARNTKLAEALKPA